MGRYHGGAPADPLAFLRGNWRIARQISDRVAGATGSFEGVACWQPDDGQAPDGGVRDGRTLAYAERGELRFRGHQGPASRRLLYRGRPDGIVDVCFADGRDFYRLDARTGAWRGAHDCGPDRYTVTGCLVGIGTIQESWHALGPDTDYVITTTLTRTGMA